MGRLFTSPRTRLFLAIIMVDLIIILGTAFPVIPVSSSEVMFVLRDYDLENRTYVYRWFELEDGNKIHIDFTTDREVNAYLFTKNQFTSYSNVEDGPSLDSSIMVDSGKLDKKVKSSGTYFFVIHNPSNRSTEIIYSKGTGSDIVKVTLAQIIRGYWHAPEETETFPYFKSVRDSPGIGSNS